MERYKCKLCMKSFVNGRALGGHMRSHMLNLQVPSTEEDPLINQEQEFSEDDEEEDTTDDESVSLSSNSYSQEEEEEEEDEEKGGVLCCELRSEKPKRSNFRLVDSHDFSFTLVKVNETASSVLLQDRESETESSKNLTWPARSKRSRQEQEHQAVNQVSSSTTTEEDIALCLMLLSRDHHKRKRNRTLQELQKQEEEETEGSSEEYIKSYKISRNKNRKKYECETCNKVFKSYQALGGHRASHKKPRPGPTTTYKNQNFEVNNINGDKNKGSNLGGCSKKVHECPYCYRVFSSGQALGGHKRSHTIGVASTAIASGSNYVERAANLGDHDNDDAGLLDLNLPPPVDDDDDDDDDNVSQFELSAVSDAEIVNNNNPLKPVN